MEILHENEFCRIVNNFGLWIRVDKILKTTQTVTMYFNKKGELIKNK